MIEKHDVPLDPPLAHELVEFWTFIWNAPPDMPIDAFLGSEVEHNSVAVFFERGSVGVASTCMIVASKAVPAIADLGAGATLGTLRRERRNLINAHPPIQSAGPAPDAPRAADSRHSWSRRPAIGGLVSGG